MTRLAVKLTAAQTEALDWIVRRDATDCYSLDDRARAAAIGGIVLRHVGELRGRDERDASVGWALDALRDDAAPDTLRHDRDALRDERDALRNALEAERAARRRDRERHARTRRSLANARAAAKRFAASRDLYRDLAVLVEAAVLARPPSSDLGGLGERIARALRREGYRIPDMPPGKPTCSGQRAPPKQPKASR
ncbi:MAG: hypothetical protein OXH15_05405 [Gammaproteobacteria bacterium]|nr:hypothetical protein [Gammaproteobacteria bacterium]